MQFLDLIHHASGDRLLGLGHAKPTIHRRSIMQRSAIHRLTAASLALVACIAISAVALAAPIDREAGTFEPLGASSIAGDVTLKAMPSGGSQVHATVRGLQPDAEYTTVLFVNASCGTTEAGIEIITFKANPAGNATFNVKVEQGLEQIGSVAIRLPSQQTVLACAAVVPVQ